MAVSGIWDPEKTYSGSWIQGSIKHRIPDPGSSTLPIGITLREVKYNALSLQKGINPGGCLPTSYLPA
jgi:hypothetical protein